jgi:diadenosine tetraphosphate (Ap4A) HIT family hydrolase
MACDLCESDGGTVIHREPVLRVVLVDDAAFPGFCRVIVNRHVAEVSDLEAGKAARVFGALVAVERALRAVLAPDKVNLASLGNVTPHVHWHVIPRWRDDSRFPDAIWAPPRRPDKSRAMTSAQRAALIAAVRREVAGARE